MSDADARKWRAWVLMPRHRRMKPEEWQPYNEAEAHGVDTYLHRDAARAWAGLWAWLTFGAVERPVCGGCEFRDLTTELRCRAWQALRDFLDGTAETWREAVDEAYLCGKTVHSYIAGI